MDKYWQAIVENKNLSVFVLLLICLISFLPNLGVFDPSLMEARNFVTAREMVQDGNWLLPTMNGEPRIAKPPFPTWLTAFTILITGSAENLFALRLPAVFAGIVLVLSIYFLILIKTKSKEHAFISGIVGATSLLILQLSRTGSWDIHCHAWMLAALACWVYSLSKEKIKIKWLIVSALFMGLSFLSKGPVSFYTILLPYIIASIAIKDFEIKKLKLIHRLIFLLIVLVVSSWWPAYVYLNKAEIGMEVLQRETTAWANRHVRPFYFYLHFPVYIGIWAIPLLASFFWKYAQNKFENVNRYVFLMVWIFSALFLLSVIPEKKERYLLPLIVPMVIICASIMQGIIISIHKNTINKKDKIVLIIHSISVVLFNLSAIIFIYKYGVVLNNISIYLFVFIAMIFILINIYLIKSRTYPRKIIALTVAGQLFMAISVIPVVPAFAYPNANYQSLKELKNNEAVKNLVLYAIGDLNLKHVYALGRKVKIIKPKFANTFPQQWPVVIISNSPLKTSLSTDWMNKINIDQVDVINASRIYKTDALYINIVDLKK